MTARIDVKRLGVQVTPLTSGRVVQRIQEATQNGDSLRIANHNLHSVYLYHTDPEFRSYCDESDLVLIDGWPVWFAARRSSTTVPGTESRIGSSDWLQHLLEDGDPITICSVGGSVEASRAAADAITQSYPHITWYGFDGYSNNGVPSPGLVDAISNSDLVLVGMGMPLQEKWISNNADVLRGKIVANVGGCIDYFGGTQKHAPRWLGRLGLEWAYRLLASPRRLAGRYIAEPFKLAAVLHSRKREDFFTEAV